MEDYYENYYVYRQKKRDQQDKTQRVKIRCACGGLYMEKNKDSHVRSNRHHFYTLTVGREAIWP